MEVRPFSFGSDAYRAALELRRRFLREPLGLRLTAEDVAGDAEQQHFGLFLPTNGGHPHLIGAVIAVPLEARSGGGPAIRIRQMVVHADHRARGLGRRLLLGAETSLATQGVAQSWLFARGEAAPFYERCGYVRTGAERELIGLPHAEMQKRLPPLR